MRYVTSVILSLLLGLSLLTITACKPKAPAPGAPSAPAENAPGAVNAPGQ